MNKIILRDFIFGTIDTIEDRSIPRGASSKSSNFLTCVDKIELRRGYHLLGNEIAGSGKITTVKVVKKSNGTEIPFRTRKKKLEYYDSATDTWIEIGTNVLGTAADGEEISIQEYHSLAGDQIFVNSPKGPYLKIMMANPGSYADMYDATKNYKGRILIKQSRTFLWGRDKDKNGIYLSYIDKQNYTTVTAEVVGTGNGTQKTFTGTLAFKAGGAKRTCFGISITDGVEIFTDNYDGTLTGDKGGTGTINYMSGAFSVTFNTAVVDTVNVTATYQWEDSTNNGICDFTYSTPRVAAEGCSFRQDEGGNFMHVASYKDVEYCFHEKKTWTLTLTSNDTNATNLIYREKVGIPNWRAAVATAEGIFIIDNTDQKDPQGKVVTIDIEGTGEILTLSISKAIRYQNKSVGIDLSPYLFDKAVIKEWGEYILCAFRTTISSENNKFLIYHKRQKTIDIADYYVSDMDIYGGTLIAADPFTDNVYTLFSGFDDDESIISNYWEGNRDNLDFSGLKKDKKLIIEGEIGPDQSAKVYASIDNGAYVEVGTIAGNGDYVDKGQLVSVGRVTIGSKEVGGGGEEVTAYHYEREIDLALDKFETIKLKFEATALGYFSVSETRYWDIRLKSVKIPKKYR